MEHDKTTQSSPEASERALRLVATGDAVLPATDHCTVRVTDDLGDVLSGPDAQDIVVLGDSSTGATVTDAIRRLQGSHRRSWLVCQGALPTPARGTVTTLVGRDEPGRAVERAIYLALVERHSEAAIQQGRADESAAAEQAELAAAKAQRAAYAGRFDNADFAVLYERL